MAGFLVFLAASIPGVAALFRVHGGMFPEAARAARVCAVIIVPYLAALTLVSLLTPGTVVNTGDSYCYDLWCLGVSQVSAAPRPQGVLYTAEVRLFVDCTRHAHHLPAEQANRFFYILDDRGRRYPLLPESFANAGVTVRPGESVQSSFTFLAPPTARRLYLRGNARARFLPWVYLYFGSDVSLFHKPALLRVL